MLGNGDPMRRFPGLASLADASRAGVLGVLCGALSIGAAGVARAQGVSSADGACPAGNLLAGKLPAAAREVSRSLVQLTDGKGTAEGAVWNAAPAVVLDTGAATITYDLGQPTSIQAIYLQGDANDTYHLWGSVDGQDFKLIGRAEPVDGHGLRGRTVGIGGVTARFLRVGEGVGDSYYSISELQAYCQVPTPFPPALELVDAAQATASKNILNYWNNETSERWEFILALIGLGFLGWLVKVRAAGGFAGARRLADRLLAILGVIGALTYINFFFFHFPNFIHNWEWFHYYIGSKYFKELGYTRLYECVAIADAEDGLRRRVELRKLTNLRTNALETTADILAHPERCREHFSDQRWSDFKKDVAFFRSREGPRRWDDAQTDHGYNGTPIWNIAGTLLANTAPASTTQLHALALLDQIFLWGMYLVVWWAFGWRVLAVGLLVFATNFPSRFYWTGGAFLRWDWLFYTVAAVCCLRKNKPMLAGLAISYATLLRVFPGFVVIGPVLAAAIQLVKERRIDRSYLRFFAGGILAVALLVPLSFKVSGGIDTYKQFMANTVKHKETPLTNYMGLRTVVAYRPSETGQKMRNDKFEDPWGPWKKARLDAFQQAKPVYAIVALGFLVLIGLAVRGHPPWMAASFGAMFIPIGVELTCYYYAFIMAVAVLYERDEWVGRVLLMLTAFTNFVAIAPLKGMPTWIDEKYTFMSAATVLAFGMILWRFGRGRAQIAMPGAFTPEELALPRTEEKVESPVERRKKRRAKA